MIKVYRIKTPHGQGEIAETETHKLVRSKEFNLDFDKRTGYTKMWGETEDQDPTWSPFGPVIMDIEVTKKCFGPRNSTNDTARYTRCSYCYKSANPNESDGMTLDEFKTIFHKIPRTLTQIAFGADAAATANPHLFDIMRYCRENDYNKVAPNLTIADVTDETADFLASVVGAVAVSLHFSHDVCYDTVRKMLDRGVKQTNMHVVLSKSELKNIDRLLNDYHTDPRLNGLNAIVFLSLKQKGRGTKQQQVTNDEFKQIIDRCYSENIPFGMDSCSAARFIEVIQDHPDKDEIIKFVEPCESTAFSSYVDHTGKFWPCSFMEDEHLDWVGSAPSLLDPNVNFMRDVWYSDRAEKFRKNAKECVQCGRGCQLYDIEGKGPMSDFWNEKEI